MTDRTARARAAAAGHVVALTGAGISAASGIPTFRGAGGYWRGHDPMTLASPEGFARDPELVWSWYVERRRVIDAAEPNAAHRALVAIEETLGTSRFTLVTQNVDGLHRRAGSSQPLELHGDLTRARCSVCARVWSWCRPLPELPPRCACGALARPDVVWFGESLDPAVLSAAQQAAAAADMILVIGTSSLVEPAASLPFWTRSGGGMIVEMNPEPTPLTEHADLRFDEAAVTSLCDFAREIWGLSDLD